MLDKTRLRVWLASSIMFSAATVADLTGLQVDNPHTLLPPPGASVAAGFMLIKNHSSDDVVITGASSDAFDRIEIHQSVIENDVAKMIKQHALTIPAGGEIELAHGGYHLMLMGMREALTVGDEIPVTLTGTSGELNLTLKVMAFGQHSMSAKPKSSPEPEVHESSEAEDAQHSHGHSSHQHGSGAAD